MEKEGAPSRNDQTGGPRHLVLGMLVILLLYVATWPPVDLACAGQPRVIQETATENQLVQVGIVERPKWVQAVYAPLLSVESWNDGRNPLVWYHDWWAHMWFASR